MKKLLITGCDKTSFRLHRRLPDTPDVVRCLDRSSNLRRVFKLVRSGSIKFGWAVRMAWAEFGRPSEPVPAANSITTNRELAELITSQNIEIVYLFRAGLIINNHVLSTGARLLNCHCCRLPDYGGLGTIPRALAAGDLDQAATLHVVTRRIDEGEVIETVPYRLDPTRSFRENEDTAYDAGISLLVRRLQE